MASLLPLLAIVLGLGFTDVNTAPQHVRADDARAQVIIWDALSGSPTFARLKSVIDSSNVFVYVQTGAGLKTRGVLTFMGHGNGFTYLLIRIDLKQSTGDRVGALAHEMTHATEIAAADPPVRSDADLERLYRRIGVPGMGPGEFESALASTNERQVRREFEHAIATR